MKSISRARKGQHQSRTTAGPQQSISRAKGGQDQSRPDISGLTNLDKLNPDAAFMP